MICISVRGGTFGIGHASRQGHLSQAAKSQGWDSRKFIFEESLTIETQILECLSLIKNANCLIIDLDPRFLSTNIEQLSKLIEGTHSQNLTKIIFDEESTFPLKKSFGDILFDLAIFPYGELGVNGRQNEILGFGLSIFPERLTEVRNSRILNTSDRLKLLISCGGSDPLDATSLYLRALEEVAHPHLEIEVVLGQFLSPKQVASLQNLARNIKHSIRFLDSPTSLDGALATADISLVTGGLTRNEAMFAGTSTVVTDINKKQAISTKLFEFHQAVLNVGILDSENTAEICDSMIDSINIVVNNTQKRISLIENARLCFPNNGTSRVLKEIGDACLRRS
jgi:spore coat polysaccharide biosynthesis predicted glycosyltransferase SpsG